MSSATRITRRHEDGFEVVGLANDDLAIETVPALGARLLSLRDLPAAREWLWRPADGRGLFASRPDLAYEHSTLAGADECLPTIVPCQLDGQLIPDHGECWAAAWSCAIFPAASGETGPRLRTSLDLPLSPLRLERTLALMDRAVRLDYTLANLSPLPRPWLYAFHPLFPIEPGDRVELPGGIEADLCAENDYAKAFFPVGSAPARAILRRASGPTLALEWSGDLLPWVALWNTRGRWHGHRHLAIEPTNAPADEPLGDTIPRLPPHGVARWRITLALPPAA